jgi:hypothetical protein
MPQPCDLDALRPAWNEETGLLVVETIQLFHLHMSPSKMAPARLVTNVMLERDEDTKLWYIAFQVRLGQVVADSPKLTERRKTSTIQITS